MSYQRRLLPSTSMLTAFEAAARAGSFTNAAKELNLSQGAVSRQVNALEGQLGVTLFERVGKTVILTELGKAYAKEVRAALKIVRNASLNAMSNPLSGMLNLAILPTFGTRWLMPRFPSFLSEHPEIIVNFSSKLSPFDFRSENLHAAIHFGAPDWPDTQGTYLMSEEVIPVCSPAFLQQHSPNNPEDLKQLPLLNLSTRSSAWGDWFESQSIRPPQAQGMLFEQFSIIAQAAIAGLGAALLPKLLIQSELSRNELVVLFDDPLKSKSSYYLITPLDKTEYAPLVAFKNWLLQQINDS